MIRAHLDAVTALLVAALPVSCTVHSGEVSGLDEAQAPAPATPYVVVRTDSGRMASDRLAQWSHRLDLRLYVTGVGATQREALWAIEKCRSALLDARPVVTGRACSPMRMGDSSPVTVDRDVTPHLHVAVDVWDLTSLPTQGV